MIELLLLSSSISLFSFFFSLPLSPLSSSPYLLISPSPLRPISYLFLLTSPSSLSLSSLYPSPLPSLFFRLFPSLPLFLSSPCLSGWIEVQWDHGGANSYRMGAEGKYDLTLGDEPQPTPPQTTPAQTTPPQNSGETSGRDTPTPPSQSTTSRCEHAQGWVVGT